MEQNSESKKKSHFSLVFTVSFDIRERKATYFTLINLEFYADKIHDVLKI